MRWGENSHVAGVIGLGRLMRTSRCKHYRHVHRMMRHAMGRLHTLGAWAAFAASPNALKLGVLLSVERGAPKRLEQGMCECVVCGEGVRVVYSMTASSKMAELRQTIGGQPSVKASGMCLAMGRAWPAAYRSGGGYLHVWPACCCTGSSDGVAQVR